MNEPAPLTIEIGYRTSPAGRRYAVYRLKGGSPVWQYVGVHRAEQALRDGVFLNVRAVPEEIAA